MILLLSRKDDYTTNIIVEWLHLLNKSFIRINGDSKDIKFNEISDGKIIITKNGKKFNLLDFNSVWFRRSAFNYGNFEYHNEDKEKLAGIFSSAKNYAQNQLKEEFKVLIDYIYNVIEQSSAKVLGSYSQRSLNKLLVLYYARQVGLLTPSSSIVFKKDYLSNLVLNNDNLITKAMSDGVYLFDKQYIYISYTERIDKIILSEISETFLPSLIQTEIKKKYELRIFYFSGSFYSTVIFSQSNSETIVDSRKSSGKGIRHLPYKLPDNISYKLNLLMEILNLDMGSIDMIVDNDNNYIFLEINPIGQITAYSNACNYLIEKEIAKCL